MPSAGTFDSHTKSVKAAGTYTYTHKSPGGNVLETGVWIAGELMSFDSYGVTPGALRQRGDGPQPLGHKRLPMSFGPMPTGGLAEFRIRLLPVSGVTKNAVLQVNCALGGVPHERSVEGIRITLENNGGEFSEEVNGRVMFIAMRPEVSEPAKAPQQESVRDSAQTPNN